MRSKRGYLLFLVLTLTVAGCGQASDLFGSLTGVPVNGVAPWQKIDMDPDTELIQPYIIYGEFGTRLIEPFYLVHDDLRYCYFEKADIQEMDEADPLITSEILFAISRDGLDWELKYDGRPMLAADEPWEAGAVGAPSVLQIDGRFYMWFAGGNGAGIGVAESSDGVNWTKYAGNPVLTPRQKWEGGDDGIVGSPSVIHHQGRYIMYYSGGLAEGTAMARRSGYAIGYAESEDGIDWIKHDAAGRNDRDGAANVKPIFVASQTWEGFIAGRTQGWVSTPQVMVVRPLDREVFHMYYTGNMMGDPIAIDVSIGFAGSFDGLNWEAANPPVNPILQENFSLTLPGLSKYLLYSEFTPSVVRLGEKYWMLYSQIEPMDAKHGLALAVNKPDK